MLTLERLVELVAYDPQTGVFNRRVSLSNRTKNTVGEPLGTISKASNGCLYLTARVDAKQYWLHRLAWFYVFGYWPGLVDHEDGNGTNNRLVNLRDATNRMNSRNVKKPSSNTSGCVGVSWRQSRLKWRSNITDDTGRHVHLGYFDDLFDAVAFRKRAERSLGYHPNHGR